MTDREKVIKGLERCSEPGRNCNMSCPYYPANDCEHQLINDANVVIKAQEPVKPEWRNGYVYCGQCGYRLHWIVERNNFCPNCGRAVKWE